MSLFRKNKPQQPEELPYTEPDNTSPYASYEAAWRAEDDAEVQRQSERLVDPGLSMEPLRGVITMRRILTVLILLLVVLLAWAVTIGPLNPVIGSLKGLPERMLALVPTQAPATETAIPPTPLPTPTLQSLPATYTPMPEPSPTLTSGLLPTSESIVVAVPETATLEPTIPPTSAVAGCTDSEAITLADVGKTMCVTGKVIQTIERTTSFSILVGTRKDSFFFVSYEKTYNLKKGTCVYANGEIVQLGKNPIMLVGFLAPLELCNP